MDPNFQRRVLEPLVRKLNNLESYVNNVLKPRETMGGSYAYGEIYINDNNVGTSIAVGAGYTKTTDFGTNGLSKNCTPDAANDKITITKTGIYKVDFATSIKSSVANVNVMAAIFLNGVEQDQIHYRRKISTANDEGAASGTGFIDVTTANWDIDLRFRHDNGAPVTVTITYGNINLIYLGPT